MNFQQFFILLKSLFTKEVVDIEPTDENFPLYLVNRYISFYHPNLCIFIDNTTNRYDNAQSFLDPAIAYKTLCAMLPKLPFTRIDYVKKRVSERAQNKGVTNEQLKQLADLLEISKREVLNYLSLL